ncbi:hypothetical protein, partial [Paraburkholderia youngii]|uniref:hypothetical protein n=1 Tax=Paraburkholderia youngii TaxID=2782701 RepID=UPI003D1BB1FC
SRTPLPRIFRSIHAARRTATGQRFGPPSESGKRLKTGSWPRAACVVGSSDSITHILMRARDGKIIFVDSRDYEDIEATFQCVDVMIGLLKLEKA